MCGHGTETRVHLEDDVLAQRIDGRVGDLRESLAEEGIERPRRTGEGRDRSVVAHRPDCVFAVGCHRLKDHPNVFARIAKAVLQAIEFSGIERRGRFD